MIASANGTAMHKGIETALELKQEFKDKLKLSQAEYILEKRATKPIEVSGKTFNVSGQADVIMTIGNETRVVDLKTTSTYKWSSTDNDDYVTQLSAYAWLFDDVVNSDQGDIVFLFTDWSSAKAKQSAQYPESRSAYKSFPLYSKAEVMDWITTKLTAYVQCLESGKVPECSPEELWAQPSVYKVYKNKTAKTCVRGSAKLSTIEEAYEFASNNNIVDADIRHIPGKVNRCNYCNYADICSQAQELREKGLLG